jgi:hypothetical protein
MRGAAPALYQRLGGSSSSDAESAGLSGSRAGNGCRAFPSRGHSAAAAPTAESIEASLERRYPTGCEECPSPNCRRLRRLRAAVSACGGCLGASGPPCAFASSVARLSCPLPAKRNEMRGRGSSCKRTQARRKIEAGLLHPRLAIMQCDDRRTSTVMRLGTRRSRVCVPAARRHSTLRRPCLLWPALGCFTLFAGASELRCRRGSVSNKAMKGDARWPTAV